MLGPAILRVRSSIVSTKKTVSLFEGEGGMGGGGGGSVNIFLPWGGRGGGIIIWLVGLYP